MAAKANPAFTTPLQDMEYRELLDAAKLVSEMRKTPGWRRLSDLIEVHADRLQARLLSSSLPSYEQMAQLQGELRGLRALQDAADTIEAVAQARMADERSLLEAQHGNA